ncbi:hypothetical protein Tco_0353207 [Tanacetum coccineum]
MELDLLSVASSPGTMASKDIGPPHHDFSWMDILPGKSTKLGPLWVNSDGKTLNNNDYAWNNGNKFDPAPLNKSSEASDDDCASASNDVADSLHVPLNGYSPKQKQFSLMWLASSSASSNPLILIFYFFIYLIQKLRQKEVDEESCMKTCSMNWGEANSVYTSYIVSSASNGKIQAGALIFVLVGYIITTSYGGQIRLLDTKKEAEVQKISMEEYRLDERIREMQEKMRDMSEDNTNCLKQEKYRSLPILNSLSPSSVSPADVNVDNFKQVVYFYTFRT